MGEARTIPPVNATEGSVARYVARRTRTPLTADARNPTGSRSATERSFVFVYSDKNLTCADCGQEFVFTASEQDFYAQRGFTEPRRCASCRASRKAARNAEGGAVRTARTAPAGATPPGVDGGGGGGYCLARPRAARDVLGDLLELRQGSPGAVPARPVASRSTAATASGACAAPDPNPLGAGRPTARRTSSDPDPGCQPTRVV